jgi:hypothetical protein
MTRLLSLFFTFALFFIGADAQAVCRQGIPHPKKARLAQLETCPPVTVNVIGQFGPAGTFTVSNDTNGVVTVASSILPGGESFVTSIAVEITGNCTLNESCQGPSNGTFNFVPAPQCTKTLACSACPETATIHVKVTFSTNVGIQPSGETDYTFCCAEPPVTPCTRTEGYWACHLDSFPTGASATDQICVAFAGLTPSSTCDAACAPVTLTLEEILLSHSTAPWFLLAKEWVAAYLNILSTGLSENEFTACLPCPAANCSTNSSTCSTYLDAFHGSAFLLATTICNRDATTSPIQGYAVEDFTCLTNQLKKFNEGFTGNAACPDFCRDDCCSDTPTTPTCQECAALNCSCNQLGCSCVDQNCCNKCPINCYSCETYCDLCACDKSSSSSSSSSCSSFWEKTRAEIRR